MAGYYTVDLTTLSDAAVITNWANEFVGWTAGSVPIAEPDYFIQGIGCVSQGVSKSAGLNSIAYNRTVGTAFMVSGECVFTWAYFLANSGISTFAFGGLRIAMGSSLTNFDAWFVGGTDVGRHPYGGWQNYAVDPTTVPTTIGGTGGNDLSNQYFGVLANVTAAISKGQMFAVDAIRYGNGTIITTSGNTSSINYTSPLASSAGNFPQMANYNDYNDGGTPANGPSVDSGRHKFGLFQESLGGYLWKGTIQFGNSTTSCYFDDANRVISIDPTLYVPKTFNKLEIRNVGSTIKLTTITISNLLKVDANITLSRGNLNVTDNAALTITSCNFNDMGFFNFKSNSIVTATTFRRCDSIYPVGATITDCIVASSNSSAGAMIYGAASEGLYVTSTAFDSCNVAIKITAAGQYTFNNLLFTSCPYHVDYTGIAALKTITGAIWYAGNTTAIFTSATHGYTTGDKVVVYGTTFTGNTAPYGYNNAPHEYFTLGTTTTNTFEATIALTPGTYSSGGTATLPCLISPSGVESNVNKANVIASGGGKIVVDTPSVNLEFTSVVPNSEIRIIEFGTETELGGIETVGGPGTWTFTHKLGGTFVNIYILHLDYLWYSILQYELKSADDIILVSQVTDRQYDYGTIP